MSHNLAFWAGADDLDPGEVYAQLNDGQHVLGVHSVNRDQVSRAFTETLSGWLWDGQFLHPLEADPEGTPAWDVSIGGQMVEFVGYGFTGEHANAIIDAMRPLGLRLYDPQVGERFA